MPGWPWPRRSPPLKRGGDSLQLSRWRKGTTQEVSLTLPQLGSYAATAPYACPKSQKILAAGCEAIAKRGFRDGHGRIDISIPNDLNALALVASGDAAFLPLVQEYAQAVAKHKPDGHISWGYAYETLFLAEYVLVTDDASVKPGLERLALTGRNPSTVRPLTGADLAETIADGDWNWWDGQETIYNPRSTADLMRGIASWSPTVRQRSAKALATKPDVSLAAIIARLDDRSRPASRYGACSALRFLGPRADEAAPQLLALLDSEDPWDRVLAAEALVEMSSHIRNEALVPLLEVIVRPGDDPADPRRCSLGPLTEVVFKPGPGKREPASILAGSLDLVDPPHRPLLIEAIRAVMHSPDGRTRSGAASLYGRLSRSELAELMPDILETTRLPAPSGEMFAYDIRMRGLDLLAKYRIREGMELAVAIMNEKRWGRDFVRAAAALESYGGAAKSYLPVLEGKTRSLVADERKGRPEALEKVIRVIKSDRAGKPVITAAEFIATHGQKKAAAATSEGVRR